MREIKYTSQFKRDYKKRAREKGMDDLLEKVIYVQTDEELQLVRLGSHSDLFA